MSKLSAKKVANLFLVWGDKDGIIITYLKLQKLLYYAQAWYLVNFGQRLFSDKISAEESGPVIKKIQQIFGKFPSSRISYVTDNHEESYLTTQQLSFLKHFYNTYRNLSATALCSMVQAERPWKNAFSAQTTITPSVMRRYYSSQYTKFKESPHD